MEPPSSSSFPDLQTLPSPPNWEHDVFLSFRGEDTRYNFTDHLSYAMTQKRIKTFRDTENLRRGRSNSPELLRAIEKSKFAVVVLSTNYATSPWCLDELAHIVKCKRLRGMEVLPVFYQVEPSEIRRQIGNYGEAFAKHESSFKDNTKVRNWREALKDIASLAGWHVTHDRRESEVIQEIVNKILNVLNRISYIPNRELVGIDGRIKDIESLLDLKSNDVLAIGIWGMGGIGKTALAKEVFKKIQNQFHLSGFVSHVRLQSAVELQQRLCESFLEIGNIRIDTVENGIKLLKKALFKKKVLIVLDDVDSVKQVECLAPGGLLGENIWGGGSRVIVTTRDRSWLRDFYVQENDIYEVEKLSDEEAFQLLCKEAFRKENPPEEFVALSKSFLKYAGGLPLAHKVLGSHLSKLKVDEWSHILHRLDDDRDEEIFNVLQVSFDGLQDTDKRIFLDIACFFNGEDHVRVNNILKGCGFSSGIGINNLIDKSLIKVEKSKLWMHDLLQCLGWHIVRGESYFPGQRSRLWVDNNAHKYEGSWRFKNALKVLMDNTGTAAVEGLFLSLPEREEMPLKVDPFLNMRNLRLLKIYNVNFMGVHFKHKFRKLRLLEWHECPLQSLPSNFISVKLVEIKMPNSHIKQLWNESRSLEMLTIMDLSHCQSLATTPDFSRVPNLERLILEGCKGLTDIHCTIGNLQKLNFLNLRGCRNLESLPQSIGLSSLKSFILSGCSKLQEFPQSVENMDKLSELYLDGTAIRELPVSIQHLEGLVTLNLNGCKNLIDLPSIICSCLSSLKFLYLSFCSSLDKLPDNIGFLEHLEELDACNTAIRKVPQSVSLLKNLKLLCFHGCSGLTGLELPNKFSGLSSLTTLNLGKCNLAEGAIPDDIGDLFSLQSLDLSENNFFTIPESISQLSELTKISLFKCSKLQLLPKDLPSSLQTVNLHSCPMLTISSSSWKRYLPQKDLSLTLLKPGDEISPEFYEAIEDLSKALEFEPNSADILHERGIANFKLKDFYTAVEDLSVCVKFDKDNTSAYTYLGLVLSSIGEYKRAEEAHLKAIQLDRNFLEAWAQLTQLYQDMANPTKASDCLHQALQIDGRFAKAYHLRGLLLHGMGEHSKAIKELSTGLNIESANIECLYLRASCYHAIGEYNPAVKDYDAVLELELDSMEKFVLHCLAFYQKEIALYTASKCNSKFVCFDIDGDIDALFKEYWCKRLHPKNVCEKVYRQPPLCESLKKNKLKKLNFSVTKQSTALLQAGDCIGKKIQYDCPGFLPNRRQHRMAGLAAIEVAQKVSKAWRSCHAEWKYSNKSTSKDGKRPRRRERFNLQSQNRGRAGRSTSSSSDTTSYGITQSKSTGRFMMSWHDVYSVAVKWRQISEPCDPVVWINKLSEEFNTGFGSHTPIILGQARVVRYFPNFERTFDVAKTIMKDRKYVHNKADGLIDLSKEGKLQDIMHAKSCADLYKAVGEDFWLATWCNSAAFEGKYLEGTRITLVKLGEQKYDFAIRTPCTPARWDKFDAEMTMAWEDICNAYCGENYGSTDFNVLEKVRDAILRMTYYWYNFMPLSRGSAAVGFVVMLGLLLAANMEFTGTIPQGLQVDWEAILNVDPNNFVDSIKSWLYPSLKVTTSLKDYPDVGSTFQTTGSVVAALSTYND